MVDRVKPWFMVYGSWFRVLFMVLTTWDDLGDLPDTQGYLGLLPEPCNPTEGF